MTRNLQPTPKMISSKSSVPIHLIYCWLCREFGDRSWSKTTDAQLVVLVEVLLHRFRSTVEVKREILAIFRILLEALQPHLSQLKYYMSLITVYSEARSSIQRYRIKFEVDYNVDIIYIRSSVDSIVILISLFILINHSSVEESNRFKISLEGIL